MRNEDQVALAMEVAHFTRSETLENTFVLNEVGECHSTQEDLKNSKDSTPMTFGVN